MRRDLLPQGVQWFRANMHSHSTLSDGYWPIERIRTEYKARGYSIVAFSDHNVLADHSYLTEEDFLPLTSVECDLTDWDRSRPIPATERNPWNYRYRETVHLNLFARDPHCTVIPGKDTIWGFQHNCFSGTPEDAEREKHWTIERVNDFIRKANDAGFLVQYNHPNWSLNTAETWRALEGLWALEILNWATEVETGAEYCPYVYDDMLRFRGPSLFCTMGDDNHNHGGDLYGAFGGSTFIGAKELTHEAVFAALERGDFFCASGRDDPPRFLGLWVEDGVVQVDCTPAENVVLLANDRRYQHFNHGGAPVTHAEFPLNAADQYFRIQLLDARGNHANSHAYPAFPG